MKIKWGMMMTDGRGKLGGQVASKNRAGAYVRTKVTPVNPRTVAQMAVRGIFASISKAWSALLNPMQRNQFNEAANSGRWNKTNIFGDSVRPSGKGLFTRLNLNQNQIRPADTPALIVTPPPIVEMPNMIINDWVVADGFGGSLPDAPVGRTGYYIISATPPLTNGTSFATNSLRKIGVILATNADTHLEAVFADMYEAVFGTPEAGDNIYYGVHYVCLGQASPRVHAKYIV